jgi:hypothetical protein
MILAVERKVTFAQLESAAASMDIVEKLPLIVALVVSYSMEPVVPHRLLPVPLLPVLLLPALLRLSVAQQVQMIPVVEQKATNVLERNVGLTIVTAGEIEY